MADFKYQTYEEREAHFSDLGEEEKEAFLMERFNRKTNNVSALDNLRANIDSMRQGYGKIWATGYANLDKKIEGGFMGGDLIFLGAISSLGKTSFALQMATQIAEHGDDVLLFSLEMSSDALNAKTISRYTHILSMGSGFEAKRRQANRLTTRDILTGKVGEFVFDEPQDEKAKLFLEAYNKTRAVTGERIRLYIGENDVDVDTVRYVAEYHYKVTHKKPFIILDYLQILRPSEDGLNRHLDKRLLTEDDCTKLKCIARDLDVPILVISAFNRNSYLDPVTTSAFREASGIEYSSDYLLGMQYCNMDYKKHWFTTENGKKKKVYESQQDHNTRVRELFDKMDTDGANGEPLPIELKVLKARLGTKGSIYFDFLPRYNYFGDRDSEPALIGWNDDTSDAPFEHDEKYASLGTV